MIAPFGRARVMSAFLRLSFVLFWLIGPSGCASESAQRPAVGEHQEVEDISLARTGKYLGVGTIALSSEGMIRDKGRAIVYDMKDFSKKIFECSSRVSKVRFSPDDSLLAAVAIEDGTITVWKMDSGEKIAELTVSGVVSGLEFLSNTELLASALGGEDQVKGLRI